MNFQELISEFLNQSQTLSMRYSHYPKEYSGLKMKLGFGMGIPAKVTWIAFTAPEIKVSDGYYPVFLYYKKQQKLILAYGLSIWHASEEGWPNDIIESCQTIGEYFNIKNINYSNSFVYKSYDVKVNKKKIELFSSGKSINLNALEKDLNKILTTYKKCVHTEISNVESIENKGLFYMEKQLEDFIIHNWSKTQLGKKYDLIIEDGELKSQQFRTDIGPIDILAIDKKTKSYVVIELKRNQTSDDTVGQLMRYMGWVKRHFKDDNVKGVIIAGEYDKKLDYALEFAPIETDVFIYNVKFSLEEFTN